MSDNSPILFWMRRDLRLSDHEGLTEAAKTGRIVIPVFILDEVVESHGAAPKWRLGLGVSAFAQTLGKIGSRLILRRGKAVDTLETLARQTGASAVWWSRAYDPVSIARDSEVKKRLTENGIEAQSFKGHVLFEPWTVKTKAGGFFKVYSPMWRAVREREVHPNLKPVQLLKAPTQWPDSEDLDDWQMGQQMRRGKDIVVEHVCVGEGLAQKRLDVFIRERLKGYAQARDQLSQRGTSQLSENLTYGEISPRQCWNAGMAALQDGNPGAEKFLKEVVWREFAYHLAFHTPHIMSDNWREEWNSFPWREDEDTEQVLAWKQGRTGVQLVDAAMRELYVTGIMHNRGRMIVASYLTKHMMTHWRIGMTWFEDCLIDWDPAANAMGWQWTAGSGPDAAPYFRVYNPDTQAEKFDKDRRYRARYLAEAFKEHGQEAADFFMAIPKSWDMEMSDIYPDPIVPLSEGRTRALEAYSNR